MQLKVLDERVYHIEYAPEQPEPYYKSTGKELTPRPVGEDHGKRLVVYKCKWKKKELKFENVFRCHCI